MYTIFLSGELFFVITEECNVKLHLKISIIVKESISQLKKYFVQLGENDKIIYNYESTCSLISNCLLQILAEIFNF